MQVAVAVAAVPYYTSSNAALSTRQSIWTLEQEQFCLYGGRRALTQLSTVRGCVCWSGPSSALTWKDKRGGTRDNNNNNNKKKNQKNESSHCKIRVFRFLLSSFVCVSVRSLFCLLSSRASHLLTSYLLSLVAHPLPASTMKCQMAYEFYIKIAPASEWMNENCSILDVCYQATERERRIDRVQCVRLTQLPRDTLTFAFSVPATTSCT